MQTLTDLVEEAKRLEVQGEYENASQVIEDAFDMAETAQEFAVVHNQRGVIYRMQELYDEAMKNLDSAFGLSMDDQLRTEIQVNRADIFRVGYSDFDKANESLDDAIELSTSGTLVRVKALDQKGLVYVAQEEYGNAADAYTSALLMWEDIPAEDKLQADAMNRKGQVLLHAGAATVRDGNDMTMRRAYEFQTEALEIFKLLGDKQGMVNVLRTMGKIEFLYDSYEEAIGHMTTAMSILEETQYQRAITSLSLDLAETHFMAGNNEHGASFFARFLEGKGNGHLTQHDLKLLKQDIIRTQKLYD